MLSALVLQPPRGSSGLFTSTPAVLVCRLSPNPGTIQPRHVLHVPQASPHPGGGVELLVPLSLASRRLHGTHLPSQCHNSTSLFRLMPHWLSVIVLRRRCLCRRQMNKLGQVTQIHRSCHWGMLKSSDRGIFLQPQTRSYFLSAVWDWSRKIQWWLEICFDNLSSPATEYMYILYANRCY